MQRVGRGHGFGFTRVSVSQPMRVGPMRDRLYVNGTYGKRFIVVYPHTNGERTRCRRLRNRHVDIDAAMDDNGRGSRSTSCVFSICSPRGLTIVREMINRALWRRETRRGLG